MRRLSMAALILVGICTQAVAEPVVTGVRIGTHPAKTRVVLDLSERITFNSFVLSDPYRVVVDLPEVTWQLSQKRPERTGVVSTFRYGLFENGTSRLVLDVRAPVKVARAFVLPPGGGRSHRLVLDLEKISRTELLATQEKARPPAVASHPIPLPTPRPERPKTSKIVVVIDPGHGGVDPGAIGVNGTWEKHIALTYARELRRALLATDRYEVHLTRDRDVFLALRRRIAIARAKNADIFLSLHADSIGDRRLRGAHVYTLSEKASDVEAAALAAKENKSDLIAGVDLGAQSDDVATILIDLAQRETMNQSSIVARMLVSELRKSTRVIRKSHRFAGFAVLKAPDVPSVLVELGYLSNPKEEAALRKASHRRRMARAIVQGVDRYFASQQAFRQP